MGYEDDPLQSALTGFWFFAKCVIAVGLVVFVLAIAGVF